MGDFDEYLYMHNPKKEMHRKEWTRYYESLGVSIQKVAVVIHRKMQRYHYGRRSPS